MRVIVLIGIVAAAHLSGCASAWEWARMNTYNFEAQTVELEGEKFKVYRHKTDKSLMVSPVTTSPPLPKFVTPLSIDEKLQSVAQQYLRTQIGSDCVVSEVRALGNEVHEFWYHCGEYPQSPTQ